MAEDKKLQEDAEEKIDITKEVPMVPLRGITLFPNMQLPLYIGRDSSIKAVDDALASNRIIMLVSQKEEKTEDPGQDDIYEFGCISKIMRMLKLSDGRIRLLVQGEARAKITEYVQEKPYFKVKIEKFEEESRDLKDYEIVTQAMFKDVKEKFEKIAEMNRFILPDMILAMKKIDSIGYYCDIVSSQLNLKLDDQQKLLETIDEIKRLKLIHEFLNKEIELLSVQQKIQDRAKGEIDKLQKEYYLKQQMKAIRDELGESDSKSSEIAELKEKIKKLDAPANVKEEAENQLKRLENMYPESAEAATIRTYLDWLILLPWRKSSREKIEISAAESVLNADHYDLKDVKERILEFLSVTKLKKKLKGPILCLVGPPGVGKTSLGKSIARALGRKFVRVSLGGIRDEAEIRGHRRTYVGALPGRIIQEIRRAGTNNPVFMLDEIDKVGSDFRGDPSSALLEALDPEQNDQFSDHYVGLPFDLSKVMFITTANILDTIPRPLLDRMEVIRIAGYTVNDKYQIAKQYLIPRAIENTGLKNKDIRISDKALRKVILEYTAEAGVRNLERELTKICRKIARNIAEGRIKLYNISEKSLGKYLGPPVYLREKKLQKDEIGTATGLAWTALGGEVLFVECLMMPGKGKIEITGNIGNVMQESAKAALSFAKSNHKNLDISAKTFADIDLHIHVPEGATPKDGPSAGITIATAIISCLKGVAVNKDIAMTGEITLSGKVLPIGGLKEKVLAAKLSGIRRVIIPSRNEKDVPEIPAEIRKNMTFHSVNHINEVLKLALQE